MKKYIMVLTMVMCMNMVGMNQDTPIGEAQRFVSGDDWDSVIEYFPETNTYVGMNNTKFDGDVITTMVAQRPQDPSRFLAWTFSRRTVPTDDATRRLPTDEATVRDLIHAILNN